ncbi:MAG: hypothetical protein ABSE22_00775 [Xanthobacteraceae bacterium]|jgi:hypothetical protein
MHKSFLATLATATILTGAMIAGQAEAMTTTSSALGSARAAAATVQLATVVCGGNGCVPIQTKQVQKPRKFKALGHG